jgi:hypothetical protein
MGSYLPFAKTKADRLKSGDPRLSREERYASFDGYVQQFEKGAGQLSAWALADDLRAKIDDRKKVHALFAK